MNDLHPWLSTPEAVNAARKAVRIPLALLSARALAIGTDELFSEALTILTECAMPPREKFHSLCAKCTKPLEGVRAGAKFCGTRCRQSHDKQRARGNTESLPPSQRSGAHIGAMWTWPEDQREKFAVREVGYVLNHWIRTQRHTAEISASEALANLNVPIESEDDSPRDIIEAYLEAMGIKVEGPESFEELCEAAMSAKKAEKR